MISVGLPFVAAETGLDGLRRARPNGAAFGAADHAYPHAADPLLHISLHADRSWGRTAAGTHMRPLNNICEDPATGCASAALEAFLASLDPRSDVDLEIAMEQGLQIGCPSAIEVHVRKRVGCVEVAIAGFCVPVMQGTIKLEQGCI